MKIPFLKIANPKMATFKKYFQRSLDSSHFSNFGPNEQELTKRLNEVCGHPVVCAANASLILDGLHHILSGKCHQAYLPAFTFPATNMGCRTPYAFGKTFISGETLGFSEYRLCQPSSYAITTAPFGAEKPNSLMRPNVDFWIVDNAAGGSPDMSNVRRWLTAGADAVVVSLHATKILTGCEGGFAAFRDEQLYQDYRKYINFGICLKNDEKFFGKIGSNHKMSELSAAYALAYWDDVFNDEYSKRSALADEYANVCERKNIQYLRSPQAFWMLCPMARSMYQQVLASKGVSSMPYYSPLWKNGETDDNAFLLSQHGLVLPTWGMPPKTRKRALKILEEFL